MRRRFSKKIQNVYTPKRHRIPNLKNISLSICIGLVRLYSVHALHLRCPHRTGIRAPFAFWSPALVPSVDSNGGAGGSVPVSVVGSGNGLHTPSGRKRERDKSGHGKPNFGSLEANLEANPVLRLFMLLRLPTVHSFGLLEKPSYVWGSLLWCAYNYIASYWTLLEVFAFLKFLSNFLPFLYNDIFWSCFLLILSDFLFWEERDLTKKQKYISTFNFNRGG